ncbi:MAG: YcnI family protein [Burkholderiaceae bacterium]|jgi:uncharacterized protein YcnI
MMKNTVSRFCYASLVFGFAISNAWGHATVSPKQAGQDSYQRLSFGITHGCEGSPTVEVIVYLPESIMGAKPMPKAGWTIETEIKALSQPYTSHGKEIKQDVRVIRWKSGQLPDQHYDEFVMMTRLGNKTGMVALPITQICEKGRMDWNQVSEGTMKKLPFPAPLLEIVPGDHHH